MPRETRDLSEIWGKKTLKKSSSKIMLKNLNVRFSSLEPNPPALVQPLPTDAGEVWEAAQGGQAGRVLDH